MRLSISEAGASSLVSAMMRLLPALALAVISLQGELAARPKLFGPAGFEILKFWYICKLQPLPDVFLGNARKPSTSMVEDRQIAVAVVSTLFMQR